AIRHPRLPPEGARRLPCQGPRPRQDRHESEARPAPQRRSGARGDPRIRPAARSGRQPARGLRAERRQRLVPPHALGHDPGLARLDPRLDPMGEKIEVFLPPEGMSPTGGATTVDYDGKGRIWVSAPDGALRFDPDTQKFTQYKTITYKTPNGTGVTYGAAGDRHGNGYWAVMIHDIIGVGDGATPAGEAGKTSEIKLAPLKQELARVSPEAREFYKTFSQPDFNSPLP